MLGRDACIDFDSDEPSFTNLMWSNGEYATKVALDRIRRVGGDEAAIEADKVPRATIEPFRVAFEAAIPDKPTPGGRGRRLSFSVTARA